MNKKHGKKLSVSRDTLRRIGDDTLRDAHGGGGNGPTLFQCTYRVCSASACPSLQGSACCPHEI
jgi:hypothetical protein